MMPTAFEFDRILLRIFEGGSSDCILWMKNQLVLHRGKEKMRRELFFLTLYFPGLKKGCDQLFLGRPRERVLSLRSHDSTMVLLV